MDRETRRLLQIDYVNYRRAQRLMDRFDSYDSVMKASFDQLMETHYIGETTARSVFNHTRSDPETLV